jgi:hypothetical protein
MEIRMKRPVLVCALLVAAAAALVAQEASSSSPYQGTSHPPSDDEILIPSAAAAKPPAGQPASDQPAYAQPRASHSAYAEPQPSSVDPQVNFPDPGNDDGIVQVQQPTGTPAQPVLKERAPAYDPDGDIVHPHPLRPGELEEGTVIRVRLLRRLSTSGSTKDQAFRTRVASDVLQNGQVLIPAGAEIDGRVVEVSSGHFGGHGTMRLRPETVVLSDGTRYRLQADLTGTPGSRTQVGSEGDIRPGSRVMRDTVELGGAVGGGAAAGAILGGPVGALTGGLIGAGVVTAHLLISHPQATLESGTAMLFTTTQRLSMVPGEMSGNQAF